jgi:KaiC/GvpD/RAD55 family RecA-like ATPase
VLDLEKVPTGINGLDELLGGGLPRGRCILLCGGPGSGKTIFGVQFLLQGAKANEPGIFVTLEENSLQLKENMRSFGWDLDELDKAMKLAMVDLSPILYLSPVEFKKAVSGLKAPEFTIESVTTAIKNAVRLLKSKRIVVDGVTSLLVQEPDPTLRRRDIAYLFNALLETGCTCLLTAEIKAAALARDFQLEEYMAQGVIVMQTMERGGQIINVIQIEKMRGIDHDRQPHPYFITGKGIEVFPKEKVL